MKSTHTHVRVVTRMFFHSLWSMKIPWEKQKGSNTQGLYLA